MTPAEQWALHYVAPQSVAAIAVGPTPTRMLRAITKLGPKRCRWGFVSRKNEYHGTMRQVGCWHLDGKPTTEAALLKAAGMPNTPDGL